MDKTRPFLIILALLVLFFLAPLVFTAGSIAGNYGDVYLHYFPLKYLVSEHLISGKMPLWDPYIFAGQPLLANPQSAVFYPFTLLFSLLPLPAAFNYFIILHFFLAGLFSFLFLRYSAFGRTASLLGSIALTFSSFLVYKVPAGHPVALSGYIWLPLVALFLENVRRKNSVSAALFLGLSMTLLFLSGHTFPFYIALVYIFLHFIYHRFNYWRCLLQAGVICLLLSALQFIPTFELSRQVETMNWPALVKSYSLPLGNLVNALLPDFFGNVRAGTFFPQDSPSYFVELHCLYVGILPLLLSFVGIYAALRKRRFFFPLLLVFGVVAALGFYNPVYSFLYRVFPGLSYLRVPARFIYLSVFSCIVLAAVGWNNFIAPRSRVLKIVLLLLVVLDLFWWGKRFIYAENMDSYRRPSEISGLIDPAYRIITEPGTIAADKALLHHHYNANGYEAILLTEFTRFLALQERQVLNATGLARTDLRSPLSRGLSIGYEVTFSTEQAPVLRKFPGGLTVYGRSHPLPRLFFPAMLHPMPFRRQDPLEQVRYLERTPYAPDREMVITGNIGDFPLLGRGGRIDSYRFSTDRVEAEVTVPAAQALALNDTYYSGWRVYAGRRELPLYRGDRLFRTVLLKEGSYTGKDRVIFLFRPVSWLLGLYVTLLSIIAGLLIAAGRLLRRNFDKQFISW